MRLLFVNHLHPDTGLIGGVRLHRLAEELAGRGHQVLLLCASHPGTPDTPEGFAQRIAVHDWSAPLVLAARDDFLATLLNPANRTQRRPFRRARTAIELVVRGGPFWRWRHAARAYRESIRRLFGPELAYATFGNLDALAIARDYARSSGIPWVMDIKDAASVFIPKPLAGWLMRSYRDASAVTLNSEFQRSHNGDWADGDSTVIYSGVETPPPTSSDYDPARVALIGSLYSDHAAEIMLRGFAAWRNQSRPDARLHYFGTDSSRLSAIAAHAGIADGLVLEGQLPRSDLLASCARMAALLYTAHPGNCFHHKLLELAVLGRPLIESPSAGEEAQSLCRKYAIHCTSASDEIQVQHALAEASNTRTAKMVLLLDDMAWARVAARLEHVFVATLGRCGRAEGWK